MTTRKPHDSRVAVLVFPFTSPSVLNFSMKLASVVSSVTAYTALISGGFPGGITWPDGVQVRDISLRLHYLGEKHPMWFSALLWITKAVLAQVRLAEEIFRLRHDIDVVICSLGCYYQLPILMGTFLRKKVLCASTGIDSLGAQVNYGSILAALTSLLIRFNFALSQTVLVESLRLRVHKDLAPFRSKLRNGALFLEDLDHFQARTPMKDRENLIGYIGRLTAEKGVMEFIRAIPIALEQRPELQFLIIGTGKLDKVLEMALRGQPWASQVTRIHWVEHEHIPDYLNRLKLAVVPSYSEGLPNLILEAMGCGTPVLATDVGGIPDLVIDRETGFLLRDNSPDTIAQAIVGALDSNRLEIIAERARALIERNYSLEAARERYKAIMNATMERG
jgi:glycosyltransferase involved in cell wall biosynthesis